MINPDEFKFGADFDPKEACLKAIVGYDEEIHNAETILSFKDGDTMTSVFTRGNISAIIGKAKSRKTFLNTMLAGAVINGQMGGKFYSPQKKLKVVFFDTEQGRGRAQKVLKRIGYITRDKYGQVTMVSLRPYSTQERMDIIDYYFEHHKPDLAFIDGIRDLIMDFNNLTQSTELMTALMRWSEAHNCHISCVLHMNKGDGNARGHLGSELMNKAESVLSVTKDPEGDTSTVEPVYMRDLEFQKFQYTVYDGIPQICGIVPGSVPVMGTDKYVINSDRNIEPNRGFDFDNITKENEAPY